MLRYQRRDGSFDLATEKTNISDVAARAMAVMLKPKLQLARFKAVHQPAAEVRKNLMHSQPKKSACKTSKNKRRRPFENAHMN